MEAIEKVDIGRYLKTSEKLPFEDLDWNEARRVGLTAEERFILTYFADIESQTIMYARDLLNTKAVNDPEVIAFLTMWNYEEYFHGMALSRLMTECGYSLGDNRIQKVREQSLLREKIEALGAVLFSKLLPDAFITTYMAWGAINELTTLRGYEEIEQNTKNPILKEICIRIAKQERRHFAWYFNNAQTRLSASPRIQKIVRLVLQRAWTPVGAGVKSNAEVVKLFALLFPENRGQEVSLEIDQRTQTLPGLSGLEIFQVYLEKISGLLSGPSPSHS